MLDPGCWFLVPGATMYQFVTQTPQISQAPDWPGLE